MLIEKGTNYSYKIKALKNLTFESIRKISVDDVNQMNKEISDELFNELERGVDILQTEGQMSMYMYAYGKMHRAKLMYAFEALPKFIFEREIEIIDWGCGQALATLAFADYINCHNIDIDIKSITLIEPSECCIKRGVLHANILFPNAAIHIINKEIDDLIENTDFKSEHDTTKIHFFSNILDVNCFDISKLSNLIVNSFLNANYFVCVSPIQNNLRKDRLIEFVNSFDLNKFTFQDIEDVSFHQQWTLISKVFSIKNNINNINELSYNSFKINKYLNVSDFKKIYNSEKLEIIINPNRTKRLVRLISGEIIASVCPNFDYNKEKIFCEINFNNETSMWFLTNCISEDEILPMDEYEYLNSLDVTEFKKLFNVDKLEISINPLTKQRFIKLETGEIIAFVDFDFNIMEDRSFILRKLKGGRLIWVLVRAFKCFGTNSKINDNIVYCKSISNKNKGKHIILSTRNINKVEKNEFDFRDDLVSIEIPSGITEIERHGFGCCVNLYSVIIPESVSAIKELAFYNCKNLISVYLPDSVKNIDNEAFGYCKSLQTIKLPKNLTKIERYTFYNCSSLNSIVLPNLITTIGESAFNNCINLSKIELNKNLISIEKSAFIFCKSLEIIQIPERVLKIEEATFSHCTSLKYIELPKSLKTIEDYAFCMCTSLKEIKIKKEISKIGKNVFYHCNNLYSIKVDKKNMHYKDINGILFTNDSKTIVCYPPAIKNSKYEIPKSVTQIDDGVFSFNKNLKEVILPIELETIGENSFYCCEKITNISIPVKVTVIDNWTFAHCRQLKTIKLHNNIEYISNSSLIGCDSMEEIIIPKNYKKYFEDLLDINYHIFLKEM